MGRGAAPVAFARTAARRATFDLGHARAFVVPPAAGASAVTPPIRRAGSATAAEPRARSGSTPAEPAFSFAAAARRQSVVADVDRRPGRISWPITRASETLLGRARRHRPAAPHERSGILRALSVDRRKHIVYSAGAEIGCYDVDEDRLTKPQIETHSEASSKRRTVCGAGECVSICGFVRRSSSTSYREISPPAE